MKPRVAVSLVTHNSARHLPSCLKSLKDQTLRPLDIRLWDNASADETLAVANGHGEILASVHASNRNLGFCAAHNRLIESTDTDYVLVLNPDVVLQADFLEILTHALDQDPSAGSATGRLYRWSGESGELPHRHEGAILDTTGIYFTRNQRHLDRGSGEPDRGLYEKPEYVFGASGAAAFFRRSMLEDVRAGGEYFDESFFAYREDADLAWRAQWMGWRCLYVPGARGYHVRRVLPERRSSLPAEINMHSFKNRFLLRVKNMDAGTYLRFFVPITIRDIAAFGYVLLRERSSLPAFPLLLKLLPRALALRRALRRHRRISPGEMRTWFAAGPAGFSAQPGAPQ